MVPAGLKHSARHAGPTPSYSAGCFHVHQQAIRKTQLSANKELYKLSKDLLHITTLNLSRLWDKSLPTRLQRHWVQFANEKSRYPGGTYGLTHPSLHRARIQLDRLVRFGVLLPTLIHSFHSWENTGEQTTTSTPSMPKFAPCSELTET